MAVGKARKCVTWFVCVCAYTHKYIQTVHIQTAKAVHWHFVLCLHFPNGCHVKHAIHSGSRKNSLTIWLVHPSS